MRLCVASALCVFPILAMFGCSNTSGSLSEAQAKATLQSCLSEVTGMAGPHKGWTVTTVGPLVKKGPTETEVSFKYRVDSREWSADSIFVQDQTGKLYLKTVKINHDSCYDRLPLQVK